MGYYKREQMGEVVSYVPGKNGAAGTFIRTGKKAVLPDSVDGEREIQELLDRTENDLNAIKERTHSGGSGGRKVGRETVKNLVDLAILYETNLLPRRERQRVENLLYEGEENTPSMTLLLIAPKLADALAKYQIDEVKSLGKEVQKRRAEVQGGSDKEKKKAENALNYGQAVRISQIEKLKEAVRRGYQRKWGTPDESWFYMTVWDEWARARGVNNEENQELKEGFKLLEKLPKTIYASDYEGVRQAVLSIGKPAEKLEQPILFFKEGIEFEDGKDRVAPWEGEKPADCIQYDDEGNVNWFYESEYQGRKLPTEERIYKYENRNCSYINEDEGIEYNYESAIKPYAETLIELQPEMRDMAPVMDKEIQNVQKEKAKEEKTQERLRRAEILEMEGLLSVEEERKFRYKQAERNQWKVERKESQIAKNIPGFDQMDARERAAKRAEAIRTALGENAAWGNENSQEYKRLYYQENQKDIAAVAEKLSNSHKKEGEKDSELFTDMLENLNAFTQENDSDRQNAIAACERYIEKRKGVILGPVTQMGRERLKMAQEVLTYLKQPEQEKILTKESVKKWDQNRTTEKQERAEIYREIEEKGKAELWKKRQAQKEKEFESAVIQHNISFRKIKRHDDQWDYLPVDPMLEKAVTEEELELEEARYLAVMNAVEKEAEKKIRKYKGADWKNEEKKSTEDLIYELKEKEMSPEDQWFADFYLKMKVHSDDYWQCQHDLRKGKQEGKKTSMLSFMDEDPDTGKLVFFERDARDIFAEQYDIIGKELLYAVEKLREIEEKKGYSSDSEENLRFFNSIVKDGEQLCSSYPRTVSEGIHTYGIRGQYVKKGRGLSDYQNVRKLWNQRENGRTLVDAQNLIRFAVKECFPVPQEQMSVESREEKRCCEAMVDAIENLKSMGGRGKNLLYLRSMFDGVIHFADASSETDRALLQCVAGAVRKVEEVYPDFKVLLEPDKSSFFYEECPKDANYMEELESKLKQEPKRQKIDLRKLEQREQAKEKAKVPFKSSGMTDKAETKETSRGVHK